MSMRISLRIQTTLRYILGWGPGGSGLLWGTRQARVMPCYRQGGGLLQGQ